LLSIKVEERESKRWEYDCLTRDVAAESQADRHLIHSGVPGRWHVFRPGTKIDRAKGAVA